MMPLQRVCHYAQRNFSLNTQRTMLLVFIVAQALFFSGYQVFQRLRIEADAARVLRNTALLNARQFDTSIIAMRYQMHNIGSALLRTQSVLPEHAQPYLDNELKQEWLDAVMVFNADGEVVAKDGTFPLESLFRGPDPSRPSFRDSARFWSLKHNTATEQLFYVFSDSLNDYLIGLMVAEHDVHGQFLGGVVGYLKVTSLGHLAHRLEGRGLDLGDEGIMALMDNTTGMMFARVGAGARDRDFSGGYEGTGLTQYATDTAIVHNYTSPVDGIARKGVFLNINDRNWVLVVALSLENVLHDWTVQTLVLSVVMLAMFVLQWKLLHYAHLNFLQRERLFREAREDPLTHLHNRRYFSEWAQTFSRHARRYPQPLSVLCTDLDYFKKINDVYGHDGGDAVLKQVACILKDRVRESDIVARFGGEEFVVALPHTSLAAALEVAERLRVCFSEETTVFNKQTIRFTASFGVAQMTPEELAEPDGIYSTLARADLALYRAKQAGRNQVMADD